MSLELAELMYCFQGDDESTSTSTRLWVLVGNAAWLQRTAGELQQSCVKFENHAATLTSKADELARFPGVTSMILDMMEETMDDIQSEHMGWTEDLEVLIATSNWFQNAAKLVSMPEGDVSAEQAAIDAAQDALAAYRRSVQVTAQSYRAACHKVSEHRRWRELKHEQLMLQRQANESYWERLGRVLFGNLTV
jgi:uncharacterized protein YoxC